MQKIYYCGDYGMLYTIWDVERMWKADTEYCCNTLGEFIAELKNDGTLDTISGYMAKENDAMLWQMSENADALTQEDVDGMLEYYKDLRSIRDADGYIVPAETNTSERDEIQKLVNEFNRKYLRGW